MKKFIFASNTSLRGTRNPHVQPRTLRFLRSVRLVLKANLKFLEGLSVAIKAIALRFIPNLWIFKEII